MSWADFNWKWVKQRRSREAAFLRRRSHSLHQIWVQVSSRLRSLHQICTEITRSPQIWAQIWQRWGIPTKSREIWRDSSEITRYMGGGSVKLDFGRETHHSTRCLQVFQTPTVDHHKRQIGWRSAQVQLVPIGGWIALAIVWFSLLIWHA